MSKSNDPTQIVVVGGGASGIFAALRAAKCASDLNRLVNVKVYEASPQLLKKVKISGGGRCNVTHNQFDVRRLTSSYPRGQKELISPFQRFQPQDTLKWFAERGVKIKAESDGRMFPVTDSSQTIIDCFLAEAKKLRVDLLIQCPVQKITKKEDKFELVIKGQDTVTADKLLLATGSSQIGYKLVQELGHSITELAPSLFTFKIKHPLLADLAGTSFPSSRLKLKMANEKSFEQVGPILITHWGLSGPALLKLSAWAAREMKRQNYQAVLHVSWIGELCENEVRQQVDELLVANAKSHIGNVVLRPLSKKFWRRLLEVCEISSDKKCSELPKKDKNKLIGCLHHSELSVTGKSRFKDEFVECGGVDLKEIDFRTMQSKICKNLFVTGELLDVDGITGGFNFQNAWTSAWIAGEAMVSD
jgi:predicted Rossmann fold flavoprotein